MSYPKFAVGEIVLLRSRWYPECNGEYTVLEVRQGYAPHPISYQPFYCIHYRLDDGPGNHTWHESALRKHPGRDDAFRRFMDKVLRKPAELARSGLHSSS